ncbi:hypothetical protein SKM54_06340 [Acinetobacter faecalis]|uniref:hypothetical protein n=1 Tax=Acinetobacter faecalis TaxID=2665161 RepID=UPI002A913F5F|nr:hypothetical protein [Acinetobacter faecalis]MDY6449653.1 hypothetical protein [Acinetobacter faecalis]MDY6456989.1 hypothetical protein [Acinetobacter faecalis]MDY6467529.1 hypothetical protein [Acinetobacter faecalis]MDY6482062.1 hypothetical protein [Acinetobacter faecalis]
MGIDHEVVKTFQDNVFPLSDKFTEMLNEHFSHQTERRGCGYTQATRLLADYVNFSRQEKDLTDLKIFKDYSSKSVRKILDNKSLYGLEISNWRNLDQNSDVDEFLNNQPKEDDYVLNLKQQAHIQSSLRKCYEKVELEESKVLCQMLADVILPILPETSQLIELKSLVEKPKVGSCPLAEKFFLKIAHGTILRHGQINIIVDEYDRPLLMEKVNMGDNHSCISLQTLVMNGIRIPAGSLFSVNYDVEQIQNKRLNKQFKGFVIPYTEFPGFWFLRLTTLAISPENRKRAFSTHYDQQVANGLFSPGTTKLSQLIDVAKAQI